MQIKLIFTRKAVHLASFWKWEILELRSELLYMALLSNLRVVSCNLSHELSKITLEALPFLLQKKLQMGWDTSLT